MWLIDSEKLADDLHAFQETLEAQSDKELLSRVIKMVERAPSPDLTKYGFWYYDKERGVFTCSECKHEATWDSRSKFCPDCGARMLGFETKEERMTRLDWGLMLGGARVFKTEEGKVIETN